MNLKMGTLSVSKSGEDILLVSDRLFSICSLALKDIQLSSTLTTSPILEEVKVSNSRALCFEQ